MGYGFRENINFFISQKRYEINDTAYFAHIIFKDIIWNFLEGEIFFFGGEVLFLYLNQMGFQHTNHIKI